MKLILALCVLLTHWATANPTTTTSEVNPAYTSPQSQCDDFSAAASALLLMTTNESHPVWEHASPIYVEVLKSAMEDAIGGLADTARLTQCDMTAYGA